MTEVKTNALEKFDSEIYGIIEILSNVLDSGSTLTIDEKKSEVVKALAPIIESLSDIDSELVGEIAETGLMPFIGFACPITMIKVNAESTMIHELEDKILLIKHEVREKEVSLKELAAHVAESASKEEARSFLANFDKEHLISEFDEKLKEAKSLKEEISKYADSCFFDMKLITQHLAEIEQHNPGIYLQNIEKAISEKEAQASQVTTEAQQTEAQASQVTTEAQQTEAQASQVTTVYDVFDKILGGFKDSKELEAVKNLIEKLKKEGHTPGFQLNRILEVDETIRFNRLRIINNLAKIEDESSKEFSEVFGKLLETIAPNKGETLKEKMTVA